MSFPWMPATAEEWRRRKKLAGMEARATAPPGAVKVRGAELAAALWILGLLPCPFLVAEALRTGNASLALAGAAFAGVLGLLGASCRLAGILLVVSQQLADLTQRLCVWEERRSAAAPERDDEALRGEGAGSTR